MKKGVTKFSSQTSRHDASVMAAFESASEKNDAQMLLDPSSDMIGPKNSQFQGEKIRSVSMSIPINSYENESNVMGLTGSLHGEKKIPFSQMSGPLYVGHKHENVLQLTQGQKTTLSRSEKYPTLSREVRNDWAVDNYAGKNEHLFKSGQLGMCNDPYCTTCPTHYNFKREQKSSKESSTFDHKFHNVLYGDARGWARRILNFLGSYIPGVMNPHAKVVQQWNKFFVISCLVAVFVDPLFFFLLTVLQDNKCIAINWPMKTTIVIFRSMTDFIYFLHMLLQAGLCCS